MGSSRGMYTCQVGFYITVGSDLEALWLLKGGDYCLFPRLWLWMEELFGGGSLLKRWDVFGFRASERERNAP